VDEELMSRLLKLARWTLERWIGGEPWQQGGPRLAPGQDGPVDGLFVTLRKAGISGDALAPSSGRLPSRPPCGT